MPDRDILNPDNASERGRGLMLAWSLQARLEQLRLTFEEQASILREVADSIDPRSE